MNSKIYLNECSPRKSLHRLKYLLLTSLSANQDFFSLQKSPFQDTPNKVRHDLWLCIQFLRKIKQDTLPKLSTTTAFLTLAGADAEQVIEMNDQSTTPLSPSQDSSCDK